MSAIKTFSNNIFDDVVVRDIHLLLKVVDSKSESGTNILKIQNGCQQLKFNYASDLTTSCFHLNFKILYVHMYGQDMGEDETLNLNF